MSQCLHITFSLIKIDNFLQTVIQKQARSLSIEGTVQLMGNDEVRILACGEKKALDNFVDVLHKEVARNVIKNIAIEPFLKEKDFRGVFRIIE